MIFKNAFLFTLFVIISSGIHGSPQSNIGIADGEPTTVVAVIDGKSRRAAYGASYESANVVNYHVDTKETTYEYFDSYDYEQRNNASNSNLHTFKDDYSFEISSDGFCPFDVDSFGVSLNSIIGKDDRTLVDNPKRWPYFPVCKITSFF